MGKTNKKSEDITIVGLGPGREDQLTLEVYNILLKARKVYFRYHFHPAFEMLRQKKKDIVNFDYLYKIKGITYEQVYSIMAEIVVKDAKTSGNVVFAVPGNPYVLEDTTNLIIDEAQRQGLSVKVVEGMSFLENIFVELKLNLNQGLQIANPVKLLEEGKKELSPKTPCIIYSLTFPPSSRPTGKAEIIFDKLCNYLLSIYPSHHKVFLVQTAEIPPYENKVLSCRLSELHKKKRFVNDLTSLYLPAPKKET